MAIRFSEHLRLVIPWNQLFSGVWEAHIRGIYLLVAPNASVDYDPEKEKILEYQVKQAALEKIAAAREKALHPQGTSLQGDDTYVEKLLAQIVRNIQITIKDVHIRSERN